jgi:hypothetical protein
MSEARSNEHRGKTTPTLTRNSGFTGAREVNVFELDPPKRSEWREPFGSPVKPCRAQTLRGAHVAQAAAGAGNERGAGTRIVRKRVAEVGRTHRASCPARGRKATGRRKQAGR